MKRLYILILIALVAMAPMPVMAAQDDAGEVSSGGSTMQGNPVATTSDDGIDALRSLLRTAAGNNNELKAAFANWRAAVQQAPQAEVLPDPQLRFGYYIEPIETRTGPQRMRYGVSQKIPWPGKRGDRKDIALRQADALKSKADTIKIAIFREVKAAYYELAYLEQAVTITRESLALVEFMEGVVRAKYSAGSVPYANVLRTQVMLDKLYDQQRSLEDARRPLVARLNAAMSTPFSNVVKAPDVVPVMELELSEADLKKALTENNPQLAALEHQTAAASAGIRLARKNYYPDVTFGLDSIYTDEPRNDADVVNRGDDPIIASVAINVPIWLESRDAAVKENEQKRLAAIQSRASLEDSLLSKLETALYKYRDAGRRVDLYRTTLIPKAEQVIEVTLEAFQSGAATSLDLIDAEKTYFELQLAAARALTDQAQQVAEMEYLTGGEIPCKYHGYIVETIALPEQELKIRIENN